MGYNCTLDGSTQAILSNITSFQQGLLANSLQETYVYLHSLMVSDYASAFVTRCNMLNNGTLSPLTGSGSETAADQSYLSTVQQWFQGLGVVLQLNYATSSDPVASLIWQLWTSA